ncbi:uncharacterized protein LOC144767792 isoform X2 [Lissotriton helveticus]
MGVLFVFKGGTRWLLARPRPRAARGRCLTCDARQRGVRRTMRLCPAAALLPGDEGRRMGLLFVFKWDRRARCDQPRASPPTDGGGGLCLRGGMGTLQEDVKTVLFMTHVHLLVKTALDMQRGLNRLMTHWQPVPECMTHCLRRCMPPYLWHEQYYLVRGWVDEQQGHLDCLFHHLGTLLVEHRRAQGKKRDGLHKYLCEIRPRRDGLDSVWLTYYAKAEQLNINVEEVLQDVGAFPMDRREMLQKEVCTLSQQLDTISPQLQHDIHLARDKRTCLSEAAVTPASAHAKCHPECNYCCCHVALRSFRYAALCFLVLIVLVITAGVHFTEPSLAAKYYEGVRDANDALLPFINIKITDEKQACPSEWISYRHHCFSLFSSKFLNWDSSLKFCNSRNGTLGIFNDIDALDMVKTLSSARSYWIGLRFRGGRWKWIDGKDGNSVFATFPKNVHNVTKGCAAVNIHNVTHMDCNSPLNWICMNRFPKTIIKRP